MGVCALFGRPPHPAADLDVAVGIVRIEDRQRDPRAFFHVACLDPALGGVYPDHPVGVVEPHRRHLRRAVRHDRREMGKRLLLP